MWQRAFFLWAGKTGLVASTVTWLSLAYWLSMVGCELRAFSPLGKLDFRLGYGAGEVQELFDAYGMAGRGVYERLLWIDQGFALVVGVWGHRISASLLPPRLRGRAVLRATPWAFCLFDWLENFALLWLLSQYPHISQGSVVWVSTFTVLKLGALLPTYGMALLLVLKIGKGMQRRQTYLPALSRRRQHER